MQVFSLANSLCVVANIECMFLLSGFLDKTLDAFITDFCLKCTDFLLCSFLDKIYCLSSPDAMEKFLKNPRPYLLPPQPRPPCKLAVLGPPLSGKTTLCALLAQKYGAKVGLCFKKKIESVSTRKENRKYELEKKIESVNCKRK